MAYPISAYFGRNTHALLSRCAYCDKPYDEAERWHTMYTSIANVDTWRASLSGSTSAGRRCGMMTDYICQACGARFEHEHSTSMNYCRNCGAENEG